MTLDELRSVAQTMREALRRCRSAYSELLRAEARHDLERFDAGMTDLHHAILLASRVERALTTNADDALRAEVRHG
jgi:hypothetical protein